MFGNTKKFAGVRACISQTIRHEGMVAICTVHSRVLHKLWVQQPVFPNDSMYIVGGLRVDEESARAPHINSSDRFCRTGTVEDKLEGCPPTV